MTEILQPSEILDAAAQVIRTRGWWRGDYIEDNDGDLGACCALGAMAVGYIEHDHGRTVDEVASVYELLTTYISDRNVLEARKILAFKLIENYPEHANSMRFGPKSWEITGDVVVDWNDKCCRTPEELIEQLEQAARYAEEYGK